MQADMNRISERLAYGGRMAIWAGVFDERIVAAASHCGCVNYADSMRRDAGI